MPLLSVLILLGSFLSPRLLCLSLSGSSFLGFAPSSVLQPSSLRLRWGVWLRRSLSLPRQSSVVSAAPLGFSPWFLLPLLCASCCCFWLFFSASGCCFWLFFSASGCFSAGSPFLFSGFAALGWSSAPAVFHGLVFASGSSAFLPSLFLCFRTSASVLCPLRIL